MKKIIFLFLLLPISVLASNLSENLDYSGYLKSEVWIKNNNDNNHQFLSAFRNTFDIGMEYKFDDNLTFFVHPRYTYDAAYSLRKDSDFDKNQAYLGNTQRTEWLRDCYLDYTSDTLDIRLGKQQVAWSQADGLPFILDRVMPFNLSYFWLPDFADIRIPLWMAKFEYSPWLNSTLQLLVIPDFEASTSSKADGPFAFKAVNDWDTFKGINSAAHGSVEETVYRPSKQLKNSRVGVRWRSMLGETEYTLNWLYGYSTSAYTYIDSFVSNSSRGTGDYVVSRRHKLMQVIGGGFNRTFNDPGILEGITLRGEAAYIRGEPTYYGTTGSRKYTEKSDKYNWFIGIDKDLLTNLSASFQFAQLIAEDKNFKGYDIISGYTYGVMDKVESVMTLKLMADFYHERLKPEVLVVYGDDNDGRMIFKTKYKVKDNLWFTLGYCHFWGPNYGSNGQYRNNDHTFCEVKYTF